MNLIFSFIKYSFITTILILSCVACGLKALPEIPAAEPALDTYLKKLSPPATPTTKSGPPSSSTPSKQKQ